MLEMVKTPAKVAGYEGKKERREATGLQKPGRVE